MSATVQPMTPGAPPRWRIEPVAAGRIFYVYAWKIGEARAKARSAIGPCRVKRADDVFDSASSLEGSVVPKGRG